MAYVMVNRLWHDVQVPLLRVSLSRPRAEARLAGVGGLSVAKPTGNHGDIVVALVAHHGGATLRNPVYVSAMDARALLLDSVRRHTHDVGSPALRCFCAAPVRQFPTPPY